MNSVSSNVEIRHQKNGVKKCEAFIETNEKNISATMTTINFICESSSVKQQKLRGSSQNSFTSLRLIIFYSLALDSFAVAERRKF